MLSIVRYLVKCQVYLLLLSLWYVDHHDAGKDVTITNHFLCMYVCMYVCMYARIRCNDDDELLISLSIRCCDDAESLYDTVYSKSEHRFYN